MPLSLRLPGIITAEAPEIALRVATAIKPSTVGLVFRGNHDPRAGIR